MFRFNAFASVLFAATLAAPAFASSGFTPSANDSGGSYHAMPGGKTRGEVKAELAAAIKDGSLAKMSRNYSYTPDYSTTTARSSLSRDQVLSELQRARDDGSLQCLNSNNARNC